MIHGLGNKGNLNLLFSVVKKGIPWPLGDFDNRRSFTSIDNLCYIIQKIINSDIPSGIYNIADACLDRIVHKSVRFQLKGESLRKKY